MTPMFITKSSCKMATSVDMVGAREISFMVADNETVASYRRGTV